ncbi:MAG: UDP-3-O-(3-hydroxymyristoyl)glucosamine N-acyltransferase [Aquificae bacterium]|nr:UDP-3-O-(3-hydroxymyristoyl)glucosamine N-acyltransferase [Aquificota bacterium]
MRLSEIAKQFDGQLIGEDKEIKGLKSITTAEEGDLTFITEEKHLKQLKESKATAVLTPFKLEIDIPQVVVKQPNRVFYKLIDIMYPTSHPTGISPKASVGEGAKVGEDVYIGDFTFIHPTAEIGNNVKIYPNCYIGERVKIGDNTVIYPNVVLLKDVEVGKDVILQPGCVIGGDGFGYYQEGGKHKKITHIGKVVIQDGVEIGANTTIDRAMLDKTVIKSGTKIDNLVMVAHNCEIGENTILVSQVGIAGSSKVGNNVILAGQVGVADHITIGDNVVVTAQSGVSKDLEPNKVYGSGLPAVEWSKWKRILFYIHKLPEIVKKLKK